MVVEVSECLNQSPEEDYDFLAGGSEGVGGHDAGVDSPLPAPDGVLLPVQERLVTHDHHRVPQLQSLDHLHVYVRVIWGHFERLERVVYYLQLLLQVAQLFLTRQIVYFRHRLVFVRM